MAETQQSSTPITEFDGTSFVTVSGGATDDSSEGSGEFFDEKYQDKESSSEGSSDEAAEEASEEEVKEEASSEEGETTEEADSEEEKEDSEEEARLKKLAEEIKEKKAAVKALKGKAGDKIIDVPTDTVFEVKVDGEPVPVTMAQLRESYASAQATHKRFRQFENEKRTWEAEKNEFNAVIDNFTKKVQAGEAVPAVMDLIAATGKNPLEIVRTIREALVNDAQEFLQLTPEQRRAYYLEEEKEFYRQQNEKIVTAQTRKEQKQKLEQLVDHAIQAYEIPDRDTFFEALDAVQDLARKNKVGGDVQITPDLVGRYYQAASLKKAFDESIKEEGLTQTLAEDSEEYAQIADVIAKMKPKKEEIRQVLRRFYKGEDQNQRAKPGATNSPVKPGAKKVNRADKKVDVDPGLDIDKTPRVADLIKFLDAN